MSAPKGQIPWNKNLSKDNSESLLILSLKRFGEGNPMYGKTPWNKSVPCSKDTKRKIQIHHLSHPKLFQYWLGKRRSNSDIKKFSEGHLGQIAWNKNMTRDELLQHYPKGFNIQKVQYFSKARKQKHREASIKNGNGIVLMKKNHLRPTGLEKDFIKLFRDSDLKLKYTGNAKYFIDGKCPDFVDEENKTVVEVRHTKACKFYSKISFRQYATKRIAFFKQYGWKCLVFSEKDLQSPKKVVMKIKEDLNTVS